MHLTVCRDDVIGYCDDVIGCRNDVIGCRNDVTGYYSDIIILPVYPTAILCHIKCTSHFIKHTLNKYMSPNCPLNYSLPPSSLPPQPCTGTGHTAGVHPLALPTSPHLPPPTTAQ